MQTSPREGRHTEGRARRTAAHSSPAPPSPLPSTIRRARRREPEQKTPFSLSECDSPSRLRGGRGRF
jgi:hypothetical protein